MKVRARLACGLVSGVMLGWVAFGPDATFALASNLSSDSAVETATGGAASGGARNAAGKRPMTFEDLQRMKRVSDPQISPNGKWVMFSVTEVDLAKNSKVSHLWVVPMAGGAERPVSFWKEGESGGRFSPDGKQVLFIATETTTGLSQIFLAPWDDAAGKMGTPRRLTNVSTEADGAVWSPDSSKILFTSRVYPGCSDESSWLHEDECNKKQDDAAAASPVKAMVFDHLLYRHWNVYVGEKRSHVLVVSATDGNMVRDLTPRHVIGEAEAPTFSLGGPMGYAWAPDSKEIAYVTNLDLVPAASTNNDVFTLRLDAPRAEAVKISTSLGSDDGPAYSPDGKWLAFRSQARAGYESDRFRLMLYDRSKSASQPVSKSASQRVGGSAGKSAGTQVSEVADGVGLRELMPKFDRWVDEFVWAPDSKAIYFASGESGEENILSVGLDRPEVNSVAAKAEYGDLRISSDGKTVFATAMTVMSPATIVAISLNKLTSGDISIHETAVRELTHLNAGVLAQLDLSTMESFMFPGAGNTSVQGFVIRPPNFNPVIKYPVKFLIHGGPQGAWGDAWSYRWNPELMAANGYVVVMVNPRGSTGYGQAFIDGVNGDWGGKAYVDLMKGLDAAEAKYPFIDKNRECALGASYGGFMANWILTHTNRFACIVTHDGMYNPQSAYGTTEELWFNEWEFRAPAVSGVKGKVAAADGPGQPWSYFDRPVNADPFRKWSPMLSIKNAKTPTLVVHSQRDYRLDVSEGFQLFTALQRLSVPSKMLYFPDEGHWVLKPQNSRLWYEQVNDWCDRWTKTNLYGIGVPAVMVPAPAPLATKVETPKGKVAEQPKVVAPAPASTPAPATKTAVPTAPAVVANAPAVSASPAAPKGVAPAPVTTPKAAAPAPSTTSVTPKVTVPASAPAPVPAASATPKVVAPAPAPAKVPEVSTGVAVPPDMQEVGGGAFSIAISAPEDEVQVGADARVVITLKNTSDHQVLFGHHSGADNPEFSYRFVVKNAAGHVVEETAYGRAASDPKRQGEEARTVEYVQPGKSVVQTAHVAKLVNLSRPGRYTVVVLRKDPVSKVVVKSNEITLSVVP